MEIIYLVLVYLYKFGKKNKMQNESRVSPNKKNGSRIFINTYQP